MLSQRHPPPADSLPHGLPPPPSCPSEPSPYPSSVTAQPPPPAVTTTGPLSRVSLVESPIPSASQLHLLLEKDITLPEYESRHYSSSRPLTCAGQLGREVQLLRRRPNLLELRVAHPKTAQQTVVHPHQLPRPPLHPPSPLLHHPNPGVYPHHLPRAGASLQPPLQTPLRNPLQERPADVIDAPEQPLPQLREPANERLRMSEHDSGF
jgi:hypothetical protein